MPETFQEKLARRAAENRAAFEGDYKNQLNGLLGLSKEEIDAITPDHTDMEIYDQLITVVKVASAQNIAQAELKNRIIALGEIGIAIANKIPELAAIII